ncbi:hypothetical protein SAMN05216553_104222 [Lentzea fradiae]|uniref:DUF3558 domain-containing protein n=1 Tax=Lentzea fradiae TaxID=200378 RepID=A0A1G7Q2Q4_9PSEU|nr:hypothetical protein [Lentzea fradiae]SDF92852.1 hypothetical protein SAMN05216553_104222 [Lentzea fradiae]
MRCRPLVPLALLGALAACSSPEPPPPPAYLDTDVCTLLQDGDAGRLSGSPTAAERACEFKFESVTVRLTLREGKFADASAPLLADGGYGAVIEERPMTRRCESSSGEVTCEAVVEVSDGKLIELRVVQRGQDPNHVGQVAQGLAGKALERLPVTS